MRIFRRAAGPLWRQHLLLLPDIDRRHGLHQQRVRRSGARCVETMRCLGDANERAPAPAPPDLRYPRDDTCPVGAYDIWPGSTIPYTVSLHPAGTTYCLRAGVHWITSAITPKSGDTFVGEYGAILDGSGWTTSDDTQAAFRAHNQNIDYVTIRNLVIRNMPQRGIHAYYYMSDHWTIESNEIAANTNTGIVFPGDSVIRNNYIHHNP